LAVAVERDPERAVGRDGHASRLGAGLHLHLGDLAGLRVESPEAIAAELAEPDVTGPIESQPVRVAARLVLGDLSGGAIEAADPVPALDGEPDRAPVVEYQRVRVAARRRLVLR